MRRKRNTGGKSIFYLQISSKCCFEISRRIFYNVFSNGHTNYKFSILSFPFKERQIENAYKCSIIFAYTTTKPLTKNIVSNISNLS